MMVITTNIVLLLKWYNGLYNSLCRPNISYVWWE